MKAIVFRGTVVHETDFGNEKTEGYVLNFLNTLVENSYISGFLFPLSNPNKKEAA